MLQFDNRPYKVLVRCMTYNQSIYILDALNGFVMQKTDFPYVCLVVDDASTDGAQEVIKGFLNRECSMDAAVYSEIEEADIVIARHKTNQNCTMAVYFLKKNLYGSVKKAELIAPWRKNCKYAAICEGDDYWICPEKLQKQVDFLENNKDYSMCCSEASVISPNGELDWRRYECSKRVPPEDMILGGGLFVQTATLLYREDLIDGYPSFCRKCHVGDYPMKLWGALNGGLYYFREKMATYRFQSDGSWTANSAKMSVESQLPKWKSEILMLEGLNEYSGGIYANAFKNRIASYIWVILKSHKPEWPEISSYFSDWIPYLTKRRRLVNFMMSHHMGWSYFLYVRLFQ